MRKTTIKIILIILAILGIVGVYMVLGENGEKPPAEKEYDIVQIRENLDSSNSQGEKIIENILAGRANENKLFHLIKKESSVKKKFQKLNLSSDTYQSEAKKIMEKTSPKALLRYVENQCEKAVLALKNLETQEADYIYDEKDQQGNTDIMKVYDLGEGTEIVLQETDCKDDSAKNSREYTVRYTIVVGGITMGKFSVTNHYSIDENKITLDSAEVKDYSGNGPLAVELRNPSWQSSRKTASQAGDEIYVGAAFNLTCSKNAPIGNLQSGEVITWLENTTRLHKIYAAVKVKDTKEDGISAERRSKLICL